MKMAQLEAFYNVVEYGSISKAARKGHLTQPAVSMQVRDLESHFKVQLLERSNKGVKPTPAGMVLYEYCRQIMMLKQDLNNKLKELQTNSG